MLTNFNHQYLNSILEFKIFIITNASRAYNFNLEVSGKSVMLILVNLPIVSTSLLNFKFQRTCSVYQLQNLGMGK